MEDVFATLHTVTNLIETFTLTSQTLIVEKFLSARATTGLREGDLA
jgi:hypothetical protein